MKTQADLQALIDRLSSSTEGCMDEAQVLAARLDEALAALRVCIPVQQVWEASGGNPNWTANAQDTLDSLRLMDAAIDDLDPPLAPNILSETERAERARLGI